ncbi:MAG: SulP family inorganic anion transporter [Pseudomonadales bacterium]
MFDWVGRFVPALGVLPDYTFRHARQDALAGMTVAAVAVPQAMAYAMIIGLPPIYGLYTAIVMTAIGALFDSSRQLINGPTNAISIAVLSAVAMIAPLEQRLEAVILLAFMIGVIQLFITLFRLGDLTRYISHSVIVGFTLGAGSLLVIDQMKNLFGIPGLGAADDHLLYRFWLTFTEGSGLHTLTTVLGLSTIGLILALRWLKQALNWPLLPELFITVCVMCAIVGVFGLQDHGVKVVGAIPASLPSFDLPTFDPTLIEELATSALAIALLGLLEAISMAKAIAAVTRQKLDMNQQCLSEAVANIGGSLFQCIPGSGSLTRSAINRQAGAVTQWSGVVSAVGVTVIMLVLAPYAQYLPRATLAGILLVASWGMVDWKALAYHWRTTRFDAAIIATTAFSAIAISIEFCVLIGVLMSFMLTVPRAGRMLLSQFVIAPEGYVREMLPGERPCQRLLIFGLEGEMFFGATSTMEQHLARIENAVSDETRVVILRLKRTRNPDAVALAELDQWMERLETRGVRVILCGVQAGMLNVMAKAGMAARLGEERLFREERIRQTSTMRAVEAAYRLLGGRCEACAWRGMQDLTVIAPNAKSGAH